MKREPENKVRRVVSCSGRSWYTNAQGAADYLFNPVFMSFFFMCVMLYATLIGINAESKMPLEPRLMIWIGLVMTSLIWLFLSVVLSVIAHDRGLTKAIYMPLILLPLILINAFLEQYVLTFFNTEFVPSHVTSIEYAVRNTVIIVTLEIMHARFVAPQHPTYVVPGQSHVQPTMPSQTDTAPATADRQRMVAPASWGSETQSLDAATPEGAQIKTPAPEPKVGREKDAGSVVIARETLDVAALVWIKSEDHYLSIQMKEQNLMLRGKLREVIDQLGDQFGVQINRSVWVAYAAIRSVEEQKNGTVEVHLEDENVYVVSKARLLMFKQNYERFKASVDDGAEVKE